MHPKHAACIYLEATISSTPEYTATVGLVTCSAKHWFGYLWTYM